MQTRSFERPATIQGAVLDEIRSRIHSGQLQPGERVTQEDLAAMLGTSIVPIREALKTLQSEALVVHHPNRGFFVTKLSRNELLELCEIRSALESLAVRKALAALSDEAEQQMTELIHRMEQADSDNALEDLVRLDRAFHFELFSASGAPQLMRIIEITWDQSDAYRSSYFQNPEHRAATHREHSEILSAIRDRDANRVNSLLDAHRLTPIHALDDE